MLARACKKLRVRRRVELATIALTKGSEAVRVERNGLKLDVIIEPADVTSEALASLTDAERDVARQVVRGATDAENAQSRGTSTRTVSNQLARSYRKLGLESRAELAHLLADSRRAAPRPANDP